MPAPHQRSRFPARFSIRRVALLLLGAAIPTTHAAPPFSGTIFLEPNIITATDPTTFLGLSDAGRGTRTVFDRRVNAFITINAYLFNATFSDGLKSEFQVNPEFGGLAAARAEAATYAPVIGRLPAYLRVDAATVTIHRGVQPFGGGNRNLLIHTDQAALYVADGILEETLFHEASHTSIDARHASAPGWLAAQVADNEFISTYARDNPAREDVAESFLPHFALRSRPTRITQAYADTIRATIPHRIAYFDAQRFDAFVVPTAPTLRIKKTRPVARDATVVRIRGVASTDTIRIKVRGGKVKGRRKFTATVKFPLTKSLLRLEIIATSANGLQTIRKVVVTRRK